MALRSQSQKNKSHDTTKTQIKTKNIQFHIGKNPISITEEYTYLGLKLTPNTKFDIASQQLSEKAMHAMYKIRKQIDFHQLPPKLELGKFPLLFPIIKRTLSYIINLYKLPDSSIAKLAFISSKEFYLKGKESFYSNIVNFLKNHFPSLIEPVDLEEFITDTKIKDIIETIQNNYISEWKQQIDNSSKLSFYSKFKRQYQLEDYLNTIKDPSIRRMYTKFRISNHKLLIEYGRYQKIPREERICKHCDSGSVVNEFHFAFECQKYDNLRDISNNILKNIFQMQLTAKSKEDLLAHVMGNKDQVLTNLFSNYISKCFTVRDKCP